MTDKERPQYIESHCNWQKKNISMIYSNEILFYNLLLLFKKVSQKEKRQEETNQ